MLEDGCTPTDIEEPAATMPHHRLLSVDTTNQPDRRQTTAGRRRSSKSLPPHHRLLSVDTTNQPDRRQTTAGRRWASNSEPPHHHTVVRHSRSARPTADDGWTPTDIEEPAATDTPGQPDGWRMMARRRRTSKSLPPHHRLLS